MEPETIVRLLKNSGFRVLGADYTHIYMEDPSCILRSFATFAEYAWIIIAFITGILITGWGISMIRGAKNDIAINIRNLAIMFGTLAAVVPIINTIWGDDLFARGCRTIKVETSQIKQILDTKNLKMTPRGDDLYEEFDIYDSGAQYGTDPLPYSMDPLTAAGDIRDVSTEMLAPGDIAAH